MSEMCCGTSGTSVAVCTRPQMRSQASSAVIQKGGFALVVVQNAHKRNSPVHGRPSFKKLLQFYSSPFIKSIFRRLLMFAKPLEQVCALVVHEYVREYVQCR
eukprot:1291797-Pyramimonas_sp.AAC.1